MTQSQNNNGAAFDMEAALAAMPMPVVPTPGAFLTATVSHVSKKDGVFLDYGGKGMGLILAKELDESTELKPGDTLTVQVVGHTDEDEVTLCSLRATLPWRELETAHRDHTTVKVWVDQIAKNSSKDFAGLRVKYRGLRGFVPRSKLGFGLSRAETVLRTELEMHVQDVVPGGDITFTHREVFEAQRAEEERQREEQRKQQREERATKSDAFLAKLPLFTEFDARVTNVGVKGGNEYGLFAEIAPGVTGLIHHSEIPGLKGRISGSYKRGDTVRVGVQSIEPGKDGHKQLELSMRIPVLAGIADDAEVTGKVTTIAGFGAFVSLAEFGNIEGLVPTSLMSRPAAGGKLKVGDEVRVKVFKRDLQSRKLTLTMKGVAQPQRNS